jgi:inorganic triphosphatase YgiF
MEIEIKLAPVTEAQFAQMLADLAVAPHLSMGEEVTQMEATYYDDIPGNLAQRKMTLRLRKDDAMHCQDLLLGLKLHLSALAADYSSQITVNITEV